MVACSIYLTGTTGLLYVNGVIVASSVATNNVVSSENLSLGASNTFGEYLNGVLDEVRIWNLVRSQCEINTYMASEISTTASGLVANYHFNQGFDGLVNSTVTQLTDASGNSNNGTLTNFALTGATSNWISPGGVVSGYTTTLAPPAITVNSGAICIGSSFTMIPSGANTYTYSSGTAVVTPTSNTSYTVTGTGVNGCVTAMGTVSTVTVNALPTVSVTSGAICNGSSFTMMPSGANTYTYSSGTAVVTPTSNTSYTVTGKSIAGCVTAMGAVSTVTVNALPTVSVTSGAICAGQSFTIMPSGANTYTYSSGAAVVTPTANTSYTVTGTSAEGCVTAMDAISSVTVHALPTVSVTSGAICNGSSFTMVPSGASTYTYSSGSDVVTPNATTDYSVTGTSVEGCVTAMDTISSVTVHALPTVSVTSDAICNGSSFTMVPSGADTYTYSSGTAVVTPTTNTSYTVTGTSVEGCVTAMDAVSSVTVNNLPTVSVTSNYTLICTGEIVTLNASGATSYTWSTGATTSSVTDTPTITTTYTVNANDENGCNATANIDVTVSACTAINEITTSLISVYPNPNNGILNIALTEDLTQNTTLEIYDAPGKLVVKQVLTNQLNTINLTDLNNGMYIFKLLNNNNTVKIGKLIKQ
jgi:hypothetical protein